MVPMPSTTSNDHEVSTREKIMEAAYETLKKEGIKHTSARAIAREGDFNQALIFYHFGGVNQLLVAAAQESSKRQVEKYRERIEGVTELGDLVRVAAELHAEDVADGSVTVVTQLMALAAYDEELGPQIMESFRPWIDLVAMALNRAFEGSPLRPFMPLQDMATGISGLFLGLALMSRLDPDTFDEERVYSMMGMVSGMLANVLAGKPAMG